MKNREELENDFEWWITCIPDKIIRLEELIPKGIYNQLDYSIDSLESIGKYIMTNFNIETLTKDKELWDCLASYIGTTYKRNVPTARWYIELDNKDDLYYGNICLRTNKENIFSPFFEITAMLDRQRADFIFRLTKIHIELNSI